MGGLQLKQVQEYYHRLNRAGFAERIPRSKFNDMLAAMGALTGAASKGVN